MNLVSAQQVVINEVMALNESALMDNSGNYPDWIELYNGHEYDINLEGYSISDDSQHLNKWVFPDVTIKSHAYLLLFASGNSSFSVEELHLNFKISSSGEALFLSNGAGIIIDQSPDQGLKANEVLLRIPDGSNNWVTSTFYSPNATNIANDILEWTHEAGFYENPFYLKIRSLSKKKIYYTIDGSEPTASALLFLDSLRIKSSEAIPNYFCNIETTAPQSLISFKAWNQPNKHIDKANIIRFASFDGAIRLSEIQTLSFFVGNRFNDYPYPVISISTEAKNLFDEDVGIMVPGKYFNSDDAEWTGNYFQKGKEWERLVNIEYFDLDRVLAFSHSGGIRVHGGKTRHSAQKSLRFYSRAIYNKPFFEFPLFERDFPQRYERFVLKTSMASWKGETLIADVLCLEVLKKLNLEIQEYKVHNLFINGEYWGMYTMMDRIDERFISYIHKLPEEQIDLIEGNGQTIAGANSDYISLMNFIAENDLSIDKNYDYVQSRIDMDNYIDYQIAQLFFNNIDWPDNNVKIWKEKGDKGKWRWILYDLDAAFGYPGYNMMLHATDQGNEVLWEGKIMPALLFDNLLGNTLFREQFICRYYELLNTTFDARRMIEKLDYVKSIYEKGLLTHIQRWAYPATFKDWEDDLEDEILFFIKRRKKYVQRHMEQYFDSNNLEDLCNIPATVSDNDLIQLIPTMNEGHFEIKNSFTDALRGRIVVHDMQGRIIDKIEDVFLLENENMEMNINGQNGNAFILSFITPGRVISKRFFVLP